MKTIKLYPILLLVLGGFLFGAPRASAMVADSNGCTASAGFTFNVNGSSVTFTSTSSGVNNPIYQWSFGDGGWSLSQNPTHNYNGSGSYLVCLTYRDPNDSTCFDMNCQYVTITGSSSGCSAAFTYPQDSSGCTSSLCVSFTNLSTPATGFMYWNFGDGGFSNQKNPTHCYAQKGNYQVLLIVGDSTCTDSLYMQICVDGLTGLKEELEREAAFNMFPNPANGYTNIQYTLNEKAQVRLSAVDVTGREVAVLENSQQAEGAHNVNFNTSSLANGIYFLRMEINNALSSKKLIVNQ